MNSQSEMGSSKSEIHALRKTVIEIHTSTWARKWPYIISETRNARRRYA